MTDLDRYLSNLAAQARKNRDGVVKRKLKTLLNEFGYKRRSANAVTLIHETLSAVGLEADFDIGFPAKIDEYVLLRIRRDPEPAQGPGREEESIVGPESKQAGDEERLKASPAESPGQDVSANLAPSLACETKGGTEHSTVLAPQIPPDLPDSNPPICIPITEPARISIATGPPRRLSAPRKSPFVAFAKKLYDAAKTVIETVLPGKRAEDVDPVSPPPPPDPPPPVVVPRTLTAVAEAAIAATVVVEVGGAIGTGFFVHPSGLLVTARHVVEHRGVSCRTIALRFANGHECSATVFRSHRSLDYALAWADLKKPVPTLPLGAPARLRHADTLLAVGHPSALSFTVSSGVVSNPAATMNGIEYIQTDTAIDPGNSGGPLVDSGGEVVGVNVWGFRGLGAGRFALPIDYLDAEIQRASQHGRRKCLAACYCRLCGFVHYHGQPWFCANCGTQAAANLETANRS